MYIALVMAWLLHYPLNALAQSGYSLVGSARSGASAQCIDVTQSGNGQTGAVWFTKRLRLTDSFKLTYTINLGSNPNGADGLVMVFQTKGDLALGRDAGGIGYEGLTPSIGVEFDTNQNLEKGDPAEDHMALLRNGLSDHRLNTGIPAPVPILPGQPNLRDGRDHAVDVSWDATTKTLSVAVDCVQRLTYTLDLVNTIFAGKSEVVWGFTSATGARGNRHTVCFPQPKTSPDTLQACKGDQLTLTAPLSADGQYEWLPNTNLDAPRSRTPRLIVADDQLYVVRYADRCNQTKLDSTYIHQKGPTLLVDKSRQACEGDPVLINPTVTPTDVPVSYRWSTGEITSAIKPTTSGVYTLTVTGNGCTVSEAVRVNINPLPQLSSSADIVYDCPGRDALTLDPRVSGMDLRYVWSPGGSANPQLQATRPGRYSVTVTTGQGCSAVQPFTILANCQPASLFVPDAFTPNGDGINDKLIWQSTSVTDPQLRVFNAWGELVFESSASSADWDGTYQQQPCAAGTYAWTIQYRAQGSPGIATKTGRVLLIK